MVEGIKITTLLFADDLVILAESHGSLQLMINKLENYCKSNCLQINTAKSKVLVFRKGRGRLAGYEKWKYKGEDLEVVKSYKYLGVTISHDLSFKHHFENKLADSKKAINTTWKNLMSNSRVALPPKIKIFEAVMRSIMCYGGQIWGGKYHEDVEKLLRFFLKKLLRLPSTTPNYMLLIESGMSPLYIYTLQLSMNYVIKVLNEEDDSRLTKVLVKKALRTKSMFYKDWENTAAKYNILLELTENNIPEWKDRTQKFILDVKQAIKLESIAKAENSSTRFLYRQLEHQQINYLNLGLSTAQISMVIRVRGELLKLNFMPHREDSSAICSLCNTRENEDVMHFLGACPILQEIRRYHYGVNLMNIEDVKLILNDNENWGKLASYCYTALNYRTRIINENF